MLRLLRAEVIKVRTTRVVYGMLAGALALTLLGVITSIVSAGNDDTFSLDTSEGVRNVIGSPTGAGILVLILGIIGVTGEVRHRTIVQTFLVSPDRGRVVGAKLGTYALVGLAFAVVASGLALAVAVPWLSAKDAALTGADVVAVLIGTFLSLALYGALGVGVGTLIRNQVAAVIIALVWVLIVEALLVGLLPAVGRWLPGGAQASLAGYSTTRGDLLPGWAGGLLLAAYAVALAVVGTRVTVKRDVSSG